LSQIVAALAGPSISGAGAGFSFGMRIVRSFVFFQPRAAFAAAFADSFGPVVPVRVADASGVETAVGFAGGVGSAASWSTLWSAEAAVASADAVASELVSAGAAATADASPVAVGVAGVASGGRRGRVAGELLAVFPTQRIHRTELVACNSGE